MNFNSQQFGGELASELKGQFKSMAESIAESVRQRLQVAQSFGGQVWDRELIDAAKRVNNELAPLADAAEKLKVAFGDTEKKTKDANDSKDKWLTFAAATAGVAGVGHGAQFGAGLVGGAPMAGLASAGTQAAVGTIGTVAAAVTGGPFAAAAAGIGTLATVAATATDALKGFAAAATPGGLDGLSKAANLLSATIGTQIAPTFVMLGAAITTAADLAMQQLAPGMEALGDGIVSQLPAWVSFAEQLADAAVNIAKLAKGAGDFAAWVAGKVESAAQVGSLAKDLVMGESVGSYISEIGRSQGLERQQREMEERRARGERPMTIEEKYAANPNVGLEPPGEAIDPRDMKPTSTSTGQTFIQNFGSLVKDMQASAGAAGGRPGFSGIGDVWKKVQEQSFQSNMEAKLMQRWKETLDALEKIHRGIQEKPVGGGMAP